MNITSNCNIRNPLHLSGFALLLSLGGCWEVTPDPGDPGSGGALVTEVAGQGGSTLVGTQAGGTKQVGGSQQTGGATAAGGATQTGGAQPSVGGTQAGGAQAAGGSAQAGRAQGAGGSAQAGRAQGAGGNTLVAGAAQTGGKTVTVQTGGSPATGGSPTAGRSSGGGSATAGATTTGGTASAGGAAQAGAAGTSNVLESICNEGGSPTPYDYSFGLMGEYAFALSMSCDVGGYVLPLVLADPEQLSQVNAFVAEATDWYRAEILRCSDTTSELDATDYGLLPTSQSSDLSGADFDASMAVFLMVIDRHDGQPDAVSPATKDKIKNRIKSIKTRAVTSTTVGLTKTLSEPDCMPAEPAGGGV